jgi:carbonic anhydrase/acetyltransferase-like protein (isoleucine patch superfamily)
MIKRPLMQKEIDELVAAGNVCDKWNNIRVMQNFTTKNIKNSKFSGKIKLHGFSGKSIDYKGVEFQTGIFNSWINESVIEDACICDVKLFSNSVACDDALIFNAGSIICDKEVSYIKIGTEMGHRILKRQFSENERTIIGKGARVCNISSLENSHLGESVCVENGALVRESLLESNSIVADNAIVKSSFIGSFSYISEAEISNSLIGPLVQIHHHSLLISALWAEGRGNVGYGANVGSNHTGRMPDQEIVPGLGQFFGLGCSVKFPANFSEAPFTMIATGVVCEPQRLKFPFSLIKTGTHSVNEIIPGWVYSKNIYGVYRSIYKWDKRSGVNNSFNLLFSKFVLNSVIYACNILKEFFLGKNTLPIMATEEEIPGLGSNYVRAENMEKIIEAYELYIEDYNYYQKNKKLNPSIISRIEKNLERDYERGQKIFDDYMDFHPKDEEFLDFIVNSLTKL